MLFRSKTSAFVIVNVNANPIIDSVVATPKTICLGGGSNLSVYSSVLSQGPQVLPTGYLASSASITSDEDIFRVSFGTLNNISTCASTGGTGSILNRYSNFTATVAAPSVIAGNYVSFTVQAGTCGGNYSNKIVDLKWILVQNQSSNVY